MPVPVSDLTDRYERLSSPVVFDILDQMGYPNQALACDIRPLDPTMAVAGPVFTVAGETVRPDRPAAVSPYQMFREIVPGSVLVMAMNGHRVAGPWGENTSITARSHGARGIVIDGGTRDATATVALGFPTFSRYVTPVFARGRYTMTGFQQPVHVAGQVESTVTVRPGDFVIADRDGIVVIPAAVVEDVLVAAERLEEIERQIRTALLAGEDREAVYRKHPKFDHVRKRGAGR